MDSQLHSQASLVSCTDRMKAFFKSGLLEIELYLHSMDDFARLTKINFANVFTQCVKSPNATSLLKDFRVELGKKYLASYHSNDSYKMTGRNKLELILSDLYELTQALVNKAADDTMLNRVFELATSRNHHRNSTQHLIGSSQGENIFNTFLEKIVNNSNTNKRKCNDFEILPEPKDVFGQSSVVIPNLFNRSSQAFTKSSSGVNHQVILTDVTTPLTYSEALVGGSE